MIEVESAVRSDLRCHDFHLQEYNVSDQGSKVSLLLRYDYPSKREADSNIQFDGVVFHHFIYTTCPIIFDIGEVTPRVFYAQNEAVLKVWTKQLGPIGIRVETLETFLEDLLEKSLKVWQISSSLGFLGYVVCKRVQQLD